MAGLPQVGDVYGKFRISEQLGHGGMGAVYAATDAVLGRQVALKVMLPALADTEDFKRRFAREAAALARVRSRHIVQIHEYGEHEGTLFLVTELVPDGDLQRWLATHGPMPVPDALRLLEQLSEGLIDAHDVGVIHRDIKPGNVLLWLRGGSLIPYLCDFGIASDGETGLTQTGSMIGSLGYMAPERFVGRPADERGDVYALGCLLWTLVTGRAPYGGTDFQMMTAHSTEPIPQLQVVGIEHQVVNELLTRAMAKDPSDRIATASSLRDQLLAGISALSTREATIVKPWAPTPVGSRGTPDDTILKSSPDRVATRPDWGVQPPAPSAGGGPRRGAWWAALAALATAAVVGGIFGVIHFTGTSPDDDDTATPSADAASDAPVVETTPSAPVTSAESVETSTPTTSQPSVTCWNGTEASELAACAAPIGAEGMRSVFPSMGDCTPVTPQMLEKAEVFVCEYDGFAVRYSRWGEDYDRYDYMEETSGVTGVDWQVGGLVAGRQWSSYQDEEDQPYRWAATYAEFPYSVSVEGTSEAGRQAGIALVEASPPSSIGRS